MLVSLFYWLDIEFVANWVQTILLETYLGNCVPRFCWIAAETVKSATCFPWRAKCQNLNCVFLRGVVWYEVVQLHTYAYWAYYVLIQVKFKICYSFLETLGFRFTFVNADHIRTRKYLRYYKIVRLSSLVTPYIVIGMLIQLWYLWKTIFCLSEYE